MSFEASLSVTEILARHAGQLAAFVSLLPGHQCDIVGIQCFLGCSSVLRACFFLKPSASITMAPCAQRRFFVVFDLTFTCSKMFHIRLSFRARSVRFVHHSPNEYLFSFYSCLGLYRYLWLFSPIHMWLSSPLSTS